MSPGLYESCFYPAAAGDSNPQHSVFLEDRFSVPQTVSGSTERFRPRTGQLAGDASRAEPIALLEKHTELAVAPVNWRAPLRCRRPFARIGRSFGYVALTAARAILPAHSLAACLLYQSRFLDTDKAGEIEPLEKGLNDLKAVATK